MVFAFFIFFTANLIMRFNEFIPAVQSWPVAQIMIPVLLLFWLVFEKKDFTFATDWLMPAFVIVVALGYSIMLWAGGVGEVFRFLVPWMAVYFFAANLVSTPRRLDAFFGLLLATGMIMVFHSHQQMTSYDGVNDSSGVGFTGITVFQGRARYAGVLNDPNDLALYLAMMLPMALQLSVKGMKFSMTLAGFALAIAILYGIFLTNSRGGMLAAGGVLTLFAYRRFGGGKAMAFCAIFIMAAMTFGPSRVREQSQSDEYSTEGRIEAWHEGLQVLKQYPLLGCGIGDFTPTYNPITAHNSFVLGFAETGLIGYVIWLSAGYYVVYALHQMIRRTRPGTKSYRQACALLDSLVAFYLAGFFLSRTYDIMMPLFFGLGVARYKCFQAELEAQQEIEQSENSIDEQASDILPNAPPLPDLSYHSIIPSIPRLSGLALFSIFVIWVVVRVKL